MREITMIEALREAIDEEMQRDTDVFCMGEDIGDMGGTFAVTLGLKDKFGVDRIIDTPISEAGPIAMCVGAALYGKRPVFELMFADFAGYTYDGIVNQAAKMRYCSNGEVSVPMVIRAAQGGGAGIGAHHCQCVEGWFMNVPGIKIVCPSTPADAKGMLKQSIRDNNPVMFLEHKALYRQTGPVPEEEYTIPIGKANVAKQGKDLTIISSQLMFLKMFEVVQALGKDGIDVELIDIRSLKPLDEETLYASARKTGRVMIVHEACKTGGWGAEVASLIQENCFDELKSPVKRFGLADSPIPYGKGELFLWPNGEEIISTAKEMVVKEMVG